MQDVRTSGHEYRILPEEAEMREEEQEGPKREEERRSSKRLCLCLFLLFVFVFVKSPCRLWICSGGRSQMYCTHMRRCSSTDTDTDSGTARL